MSQLKKGRTADIAANCAAGKAVGEGD